MSSRETPAAEGVRSTNALRVATYNIHKGFSPFNRRMMVRDLRDQLHTLAADVVFLQEVHGRHDRHAARFEHWPAAPQYEFLADSVWHDFAYGRNAVYDHGDHGNAILSRYPISKWDNIDVSAYFFERLFWTISGRERSLKRQFVRFVTDQMSETEDILVSFNKSSVS